MGSARGVSAVYVLKLVHEVLNVLQGVLKLMQGVLNVLPWGC